MSTELLGFGLGTMTAVSTVASADGLDITGPVTKAKTTNAKTTRRKVRLSKTFISSTRDCIERRPANRKSEGSPLMGRPADRRNQN